MKTADGPMAPWIATHTFVTGRQTVGTEGMESFHMHPQMVHELAKIKIAEELEYAARMRRAREAVSDRPRSIDFSNLGQRLRIRLLGGSLLGGKPTGSPA